MKQKKNRTKKQRGGLRGQLYGGTFEPNAGINDYTINNRVSNLLETTVKNSFTRGVSSSVSAALKSGTTPLAGMANLSQLEDGPASLMILGNAISSIPGTYNDVVNGRARNRIINMLNGYSNHPEVKISYPHLWSDITDENKSKKYSIYGDKTESFKREDWLTQHPLPQDLAFKSISERLKGFFSRKPSVPAPGADVDAAPASAPAPAPAPDAADTGAVVATASTPSSGGKSKKNKKGNSKTKRNKRKTK